MILKQDLRYFQEKQILVASIDIGTNSTHLLVAEINLELKSFSIKFTDKSTTRLGERAVSYTHLTLPTMLMV